MGGGFNERHVSNRLTDKLVDAAAQGPATRRVLAFRAELNAWHIGPTLAYLVEMGRLVRIGTLFQAHAAGMKTVDDCPCYKGKFSRSDASVYALPGTAPLPALRTDVESCINASKQIPSKPKGNIAGPIVIKGYRWPSIGQWRGRGGE